MGVRSRRRDRPEPEAKAAGVAGEGEGQGDGVAVKRGSSGERGMQQSKRGRLRLRRRGSRYVAYLVYLTT